MGGVPRTLIIDNLRAAVTRADWFDPELNPKLQAWLRRVNRPQSQKELDALRPSVIRGTPYGSEV